MQTMEITTWSAFKTLISSKALSLQYSDVDNYYDIYAPEAGVFLWHIALIKGTGDATDFETNFKSAANGPLEIKSMVGRPERISISPQPLGTYNKWRGFQVVLEPGMTYSFVDIFWSSNVYFRGGNLYTDSTDGSDYIAADVLMNPTNAMLMPGMIQNAYVFSESSLSFLSDETMIFPTYMKLRLHCYSPNGLSATDTKHFNILTEFFQ